MGRESLAQAAGQVLALRGVLVPPEILDTSPIEPGEETAGSTRRHRMSYGRGKVPKKFRSTVKEAPLDPLKLDKTCLEITGMDEIQRLLAIPNQNRTPPACRSQTQPKLTGPQLFRSLCICYNDNNGYAILLRSKFFSLGPRGLKVGTVKFSGAINVDQQPSCCELTSRPGPDRRPVFVLEYANKLISQETNQACFVLAAQMNVTKAVQEFTSDLVRKRMRDKAEEPLNRRKASFYQHPSASLKDSGVCLAGSNEEGQAESQDIDWTTIDDDDPVKQKPGDKLQGKLKVPFARLIQHVRSQHERAFVLSAETGSAAKSWRIAYTSPALHSRPADLAIALTRTDRGELMKLGTLLAGKNPVRLRVKWGEASEELLLVAEPMLMGDKMACWLCFLVDFGAE